MPFCAARCRLGEDRLLKRTWSRVRSQGAGVRATQGSPGTFIDSIGTRGQRVEGAGPTSRGPGCASAHSDCRTVSLANAPNALSRHTQWKSARIWTFHSDSFLPGCLEDPMNNFGPRSSEAKNGVLGLCLRPSYNPSPRGHNSCFLSQWIRRLQGSYSGMLSGWSSWAFDYCATNDQTQNSLGIYK